jgi:xanthine dehydrogenase YagS FAD-binding subunit
MNRRVWSFALVSVAAQLRFTGDLVKDARLVLGGVASVPWFLADAEVTLRNQSMDVRMIDKIVDLAMKESIPLRKNAYKIPLIKALVKQALNSLRS